MDAFRMIEAPSGPFQIRKPQHFATKEMEYSQQLPTALQNADRILTP